MYQRLVLVGNLGRDPEMRYSPNGVPITNFSVATNQKWTDAEGQLQEETIWFRIAVYGKQAENCNQYLTKGQKVLIEGTLIADPKTGSPRTYERKDGTHASSFEVRANTVRFLSGKGEAETAGGSGNGKASAKAGASADEEFLF
jgi:single-strand DNA-binding protein